MRSEERLHVMLFVQAKSVPEIEALILLDVACRNVIHSKPFHVAHNRNTQIHYIHGPDSGAVQIENMNGIDANNNENEPRRRFAPRYTSPNGRSTRSAASLIELARAQPRPQRGTRQCRRSWPRRRVRV